MSIFLGKNSKEDIGNIFYYENGKEKSIRGVFLEDTDNFMNRVERLVWPSESKYKFWLNKDYSNNKFDDNWDYVLDNVDENGKKTAGKTNLKVYVRSSSRFFRHRYPWCVKNIDGWASINQDGSIADKIIFPDGWGNGDNLGSKEKPDGSFTIYVSPNYSRMGRETRLIAFQLDDKIVNEDGSYALTGLWKAITIKQKKDEPLGTIDYSNGKIKFYEDSKYTKEIESYGTESSPLVNANGGTIAIYFTIQGQVMMESGKLNQLFYYGNNGETLDSSNFIITDDRISSISNIIYVGDGKWQAFVTLKPNYPNSDSLSTYIRNISVSPSNITSNGGNVYVKWKIFKGGASTKRKTSFMINVPNSQSYIQGPSIWQNGGDNVENEYNGEKCLISIPDDASSWLSKTGDISHSVDGYYMQTFYVKEQTYTTKYFIENLKTEKSIYTYDSKPEEWWGNYPDNYNNDVPLCVVDFNIYSRNVYDSRNTQIRITCNESFSIANIKQEGMISENIEEITSIDSAFITSKIVGTETPFFVKEVSKSKYDEDERKFKAYYTFESNLAKDISPTIFIEENYPKTISYKAQDVSISWYIGYGKEVKSKERQISIEVEATVFDGTNLHNTDKAFVVTTQEGSSNGNEISYDDNASLSCELKNNTDEITSTSKLIKNHICTGIIHVNENKEHSDEAYIKPVEIVSYSPGTLSNDSKSSVYCEISGIPVYKAEEREIEFSLSNKGNSKTIQTTQNAAEYIEGTEKVPYANAKTSSFETTGDGAINGIVELISATNGLYKIPVYINKNDDATQYNLFVQLGSNYAQSNIMVNPGIDTTKDLPEYEVSPRYNNLTTKITAGWSKTGKPVNKTIHIRFKDIDYVMDCTWENVPYSGTSIMHMSYGDDFLVKQTSESWYKVENDMLVTMRNDTDSDKHSKIIVNVVTPTETTTLNVPLYQTILAKSTDFEFSNSLTSDYIRINMSNGSLNSFSFTVNSYDKDLNQPVNIHILENDKTINSKTLDGKLTIQDNANGSVHIITLMPSSTNFSTDPNIWHLKVMQEKTNKYFEFTIEQPAYQFYFENDKNTIKEVTINPKNPNTNVNLISTKIYMSNGNKAFDKIGWKMTQDASWYLTEESTYLGKVYLTCTNKNPSTKANNSEVVLIQPESNKELTISVIENGWRDPEFDNTQIDLYYLNDYHTIEFWSQEYTKNGGTILEANVSKSYGVSKENQIVANISNSTSLNRKSSVKISCNEELVGDTKTYRRFIISNKNETIGEVTCWLHAFIFYITSDENDEITWYVSSKTNELWSNYYVYSRIDGESCNFYFDQNPDLKVLINKNLINIWANSNNDTNNRRTFYLTLHQQISQKTIKIKVIQLAKDEYEEIYV